MFDVNGWEFVLLAVLALVVLGPEKLPKYAADTARMIRTVRRMARDAREEVRESLGPEFADISLDDLDPRRLARKHLFDPDELNLDLDVDRDLDDLDVDGPAARPRHRRPGRHAAGRPDEVNGSEGAPRALAPYDPDAT